jgi:hypothetical protein
VLALSQAAHRGAVRMESRALPKPHSQHCLMRPNRHQSIARRCAVCSVSAGQRRLVPDSSSILGHLRQAAAGRLHQPLPGQVVSFDSNLNPKCAFTRCGDLQRVASFAGI